MFTSSHSASPLPGARVLATRVHALSMDECVERIVQWAREGGSRTVVTTNVHAAVTADRDASFRAAVNGADLNTPDGWPIARTLRRAGFPAQARVSGPDLMLEVARAAARAGLPVYLYGGHAETHAALRERLCAAAPGLVIAGSDAPPFRALSEAEDAIAVERIRASGARIVFVGLGCPKQELWQEAHRGRVDAVMLGVGAAFDFHAGRVARAPSWMQRHGLEWAHRLAQEPRRLARRYLVTNTWFLARLLAARVAPARQDPVTPIVQTAETPRR